MAAEPEEKKTEAEVSSPSSDASAGPPSGAALKGPEAPADDVEGSDLERSDEDSPQQQENRRARRAAAAKARKMRMRERQEAEAVGLDTQEVLDDALVRSRAKVMKWLSRNSSTLQAVVVVGLVGWAAWGGYEVYTASARADASDVLAKGLTAEAGRVGDPETAKGANDMGIVDPTPVFKDDPARLAAARDAFAKATVVREGSGTALYAKLSLAAVQLDEGKNDEAKASFESVLNSPLASSDLELKGRALEGLALVLEAKADKEGALGRYGELEKLGPSFADAALYERARLQRDLGRNDEAKATLKKLREKLGPQAPGEFAPSFLRQRVQTLSQELDPEAARAWSQPPALTPERLKQLEEQVKKSIGKQSDAPMPPPEMPAMPLPSGAASGSP